MLEIAQNGGRKDGAFEVKCEMKHDIEKKRKSKVNLEGLRSSSPRRKKFQGKKQIRGLQEYKTSRPATVSNKASAQKEMPVIIGIHQSALFINKETVESVCGQAQRKWLDGGEPKKQNNSVAVAKTLDITQAGQELTSLKF